MIILSNTTDKLEVVLSGNVTANHLPCISFWRDVTTTTYTPSRTVINSNNTTAVDISGSPDSSTQRVIDFISVFNADTAPSIVTIRYNANGTTYILYKATLAVGDKIEYTDKTGFQVIGVNNGVKFNSVQGNTVAVTNALNITVMSQDVVNNNATLNTIADVTGLSFPVTAGEMYWFEFVIPYTSAVTSTGSRWSINGPGSPTLLNYRSEYTLTATTTTVNSATAYDTPAASNASSLTAGNVATIWGYIKPSQNGTVIARFASEIANSAITALAGATVRWIRVL